MNFRARRASVACVLGSGLAAFVAVGCAQDDKSPPAPAGTEGPVTSATVGTSATGSGSGSGGSASSGGSSGGPATCADFICKGHGVCADTPEGPRCECDPGYVVDPGDSSLCIVDESCIQVRFLEDHCRQLLNSAPAVALFFAVDFCAGTAVTPDKLAALGGTFLVKENGVNIAENVESYATVIPKGVENYVSLVVDVSDSLVGSGDFSALVDELRDLVTNLTPGAGEPDTYVSVIVFGRFVKQYVPFTRDLDAVDTALGDLAADPAAALDGMDYIGPWNGMGTVLYDAVEKGIEHTDRIRELRELVTGGGMLATGTVVVITDGQDTSNDTLDQSQIDGTISQVLSIGISPDASNVDLQNIGRDGSFLAPTPAEWPQAFDEISQRVAEYPERAYLLGYCSSATADTPNVSVEVLSAMATSSAAVCNFNADLFASNPPACGETLFTTECDALECGGLTACGACTDDACCSGGTCASPGIKSACEGLDKLCAATGQVCGATGDPMNPYTCVDGAAMDAACDGDLIPCARGLYCHETTKVCTAQASIGSVCDDASHCQSGHCDRLNPDNPLEDKICQYPALDLIDNCEGGAVAICEAGAYCAGDCATEKPAGAQCSSSDECASGYCAGTTTKFCSGAGVCYWSWDSKL